MSYSLKEIFFTLQGEGRQAGRAAVFARFAGCNLWSGREQDRASAPCWFCDTDFIGTDGPGGGKFTTATDLAAAVRTCWDEGGGPGGVPLVVFTGGEPMLQLDDAAIDAVHAAGVSIAIETNGTIPVPRSIDWICVSPKPNSEVVQRSGDELKLVYPHQVTPDEVADWDFTHFYLQPLDGPERTAHTDACVAYCRAHPKWRLSLQTHKLIGIP
ncbi:MAG: 7-carboxy-7-deazaguanine synthase [Proteobacteria bacterium]|nr:7-carboxy-7-deazaguanine synthase [Pseudomonadota bacterium]